MTNSKSGFRMEKDSSGEMQIPEGAYWGINTARAQELFAISGGIPHRHLIEALVLVKKACAQANLERGKLDAKQAQAITSAANEVLNGRFREQFVVDPFASGEAINDNVNEVLANRALELVGHPPGTYGVLSPSLHVNLGQTANDTFPTAMRVAVLLALKELEPAILDLERLLRRKSLEFDRLVKTGRAHLQDSLPISLGQEFNAYGSSVQRSYRRIISASQSLYELNIGAGPIGTGFEGDLKFVNRVVDLLSNYLSLRLKPAEDFCFSAQSMSDFAEFSSALKEMAVELVRIANDLRLLGSGPKAGFGEITLAGMPPFPSPLMPDVLPHRASSALAESLTMVSFETIGADTTIMFAVQAGQLEANAMTPIIVYKLLNSMDLLKNVIPIFNQRCVALITANLDRLGELLEASGIISVVLASHIGQEQAEALTREAQEIGRPVRDLAIERNLITQELLDALLHYKSLARYIHPS